MKLILILLFIIVVIYLFFTNKNAENFNIETNEVRNEIFKKNNYMSWKNDPFNYTTVNFSVLGDNKYFDDTTNIFTNNAGSTNHSSLDDKAIKNLTF